MGHGAENSRHSISVKEHRDRILATITPLLPIKLPPSQALGRVLAENISAKVNLPTFDNSAMDGYAVRHTDTAKASASTPVALKVVADLPAGSAENPRLGPGQTARIMTGAPVPDDADCIVPIEDTETGIAVTTNPVGSSVHILRAPEPAAHIRRVGSDAREGETVFAAGRTLNARALAAAAATGSRNILVSPAPRVGVLSTGSELMGLGEPLLRGQIHDSNSTLLAALVTECGGTPVQIGAIPDDEAALHDVLSEFAPSVDVFVTSGGVSVGAFDVVKAVLAPLGVWFGPVRMQPGKPQGFGEWPADGCASGMPGHHAAGTPIFALPGNPVSVFVSFESFVRPALLSMQGHSDILRDTVQAVATEGWHSPPGRVQYMPAIAYAQSAAAVEVRRSGGARHDSTEGRGAGFWVRPASSGGSGSYLVANLAKANALAIVPENVSDVHEGDLVTVTLVR